VWILQLIEILEFFKVRKQINWKTVGLLDLLSIGIQLLFVSLEVLGIVNEPIILMEFGMQSI